VFIARFVTGLRVFGAILAGTSGLPWGRFLLYNAAGAIAWATTFGAVGYFLAYSWETLEEWIGRSGLVLLAALAVIAVVALLRRRRGSA
jgi:membrane protein DedA with SNARE-associated domain